MAAERLPMRKIKEVLRLKAAGLSERTIAKSTSVARSTVSDYLKRAKEANISWPLDADLGDDALLKLLFSPKEEINGSKGKVKPDFTLIHKELKKKGVTLRLLWEEYSSSNENTYRYSQFCHLYRNWEGHLKPSLRACHKAGEKMFVDYAGQTFPVIDRLTGEIQEAQIFVSSLGASNYIFAKATPSQELHWWISSHVACFNFLGGVPQILVPDNLKSAVTKTCRYEPDINPTYHDMAMHYGITIIPARVAHPKDKPKVENAVQQVERWVLAPLRNQIFFSFYELNQAISKKLKELNNKNFQVIEGSRYQLFLEVEKQALKPLPKTPYEFATWKCAKVNIDYHVQVEKNYYSTPYRFIHQKVDVRLTASTIEIFHKGVRLTSHLRAYGKGIYVTKDEHRPKSHRKYLEWSPSRIISWAKKVGPNCASLVEIIMTSKTHPEQGFRSCIGIIHLGKAYSDTRLEAACQRAIDIGSHSYQSVKSILKKNLDLKPIANEVATLPVIKHENIRGGSYYQEKENKLC